MVFFTCNACGESVKKAQVDKHVTVCRQCQCLSCIDCGRDFWGDDYKNHVKCISEDQKYGGKGYEGKAHKGDIKQQAWIQKVNELVKRPNVSPKVRELLEQISAFDNVPRKRAKFQNWMKNSLKIHNESILEQVWSIFSEASKNEGAGEEQKQPLNQGATRGADAPAKAPSTDAPERPVPERPAEAKKNKRQRKEERQKSRKKEKKELKLGSQQDSAGNQKVKKRKGGPEAAGEAPEASGRKKGSGPGPDAGDVNGAAGPVQHPSQGDPKGAATGKRKRKHSEGEADTKKKKIKFPGHPEGGETEAQASPVKGKFNWKGTIKAILKQAPDNEIAVKKLKKKVLAQYYAVGSEHHRSEEELLAIFHKKISKNPSFKLLKDRVKLVK
ncbi:cell growth-regulating nucleolar protein [Rhynchocyon petersi]